MKLLSRSRIGGKGADYGIFLFIRLYPSFLDVFHVNAETQGTIIDTYQLIVTKEAMSGCINEFLIVDGKKFPLPDSLNTSTWVGERVVFSSVATFIVLSLLSQ